MGNRTQILELLLNYKGWDAGEEDSRKKMIEFIKANPECFENDFKLGHVTGSALVVDKEYKQTLLTHHSKIDRWFQFGGHSDSEPDVISTAYREAVEESGIGTLAFAPGHEGIFDVDIHPIPARKTMPEHLHYDVRILLLADPKAPIVVSSESKDLKWIKLAEVKDYNQQPAFLRMINKVSDISIYKTFGR